GSTIGQYLCVLPPRAYSLLPSRKVGPELVVSGTNSCRTTAFRITQGVRKAQTTPRIVRPERALWAQGLGLGRRTTQRARRPDSGAASAFVRTAKPQSTPTVTTESGRSHPL